MLENLQPNRVFHYFEEICQIPHGSYNVDKISDYLMDFAREHGLQARQDQEKNVIMIKKAAKGLEDRKPIMIQGHMDMVAVKDADCDKNMETDGLDLAIDGDYIYAKGTSLGGDDGIAVAYGLALLDDDTLQLPRIELVVTTQEEVGMEGAAAIDLSCCEATTMLNIDSETEGEFCVSCAGGIRLSAEFTMDSKVISGEDIVLCKLDAKGFTGGHSGVEIHKNSANANKVMAQVLTALTKEMDVSICEISGGSKDNAIPIDASCVIAYHKGDQEKLTACVKTECEKVQEAYKNTDPHGVIEISDVQEKKTYTAFDSEKQAKLLAYLKEVPNGVQTMSKNIEGLVQTSLNLGIVTTMDDKVEVTFALRSSVQAEKEDLIKTVTELAEANGATVTSAGDYPGWEYKEDSSLRTHMVEVYKKQYGEEPKVLAIHAGLECGLLISKKPELDCISFGPNILDIHTTSERLSISSVERVWNFLLEVVKTYE